MTTKWLFYLRIPVFAFTAEIRALKLLCLKGIAE